MSEVEEVVVRGITSIRSALAAIGTAVALVVFALPVLASTTQAATHTVGAQGTPTPGTDITNGPLLVNQGDNVFAIAMETTNSDTVSVSYGTSSSSLTFNMAPVQSGSEPGYVHLLQAAGLNPATAYYYQVTENGSNVGSEQSFTTYQTAGSLPSPNFYTVELTDQNGNAATTPALIFFNYAPKAGALTADGVACANSTVIANTTSSTGNGTTSFSGYGTISPGSTRPSNEPNSTALSGGELWADSCNTSGQGGTFSAWGGGMGDSPGGTIMITSASPRQNTSPPTAGVIVQINSAALTTPTATAIPTATAVSHVAYLPAVDVSVQASSGW